MDILTKSETGIYGLASANGFSEYITGKDMFGNALSEAERVNSLQYSIIGPFYKKGLNNGVADDVVGVSGSKKTSDESTVSSSVKGTSNANPKIRLVDGKKEYNVKGKWLTEKQFSVIRQRAVRQAWRAEKELVEQTGRGTRDWTSDEINELLISGKVRGYEGQHMKSANEYPDFAGEPNNIQFLKGRTMDVNEHLDAHRGNYKNPTNGYYYPNTGAMVDFDDKVPWE